MKKEDIKEQKLDNHTHIVVILDKSASMSGLSHSTISGFNGFMKEQKTVASKATVSLVQFAAGQDWVYDMMPVAEVSDLTSRSYNTDGPSTALCDSIARAVHRAENQIKEMNEKPDNVVVVIITDGQENDSKEFQKKHIVKIIEAHEKEGWDFVFLGANQDAIAEGGSIGVRASNALTYGATQDGVHAMYASVSENLTNYRGLRSKGNKGKIGFFVDTEDKAKNTTEQ